MSFRSMLRRFVGSRRNSRENEQEALFRSMVEQSADVICHKVGRRFTYISPSGFKTFGWDPEEALSEHASSKVYEGDAPVVESAIARLFAGYETSVMVQCRVICGDGSLRWCETTGHVEPDPSGAHRIVLVMRDISDRKRLEEELAKLALQDGLTGIGNRRAFDQALDDKWKRTLQEGGQMALLLLDVDCFKQFNDLYGHQAGDDCLRAVASCIRECVRRPDDAVCRYGGEEIAVILGSSGADDAMQMAEVIRSSIEALGIPHEQSPCAGHVTASIGVAAAVARVGGSMRMPESLLQAADHALYKAKAGGRNRVDLSVLIAPADKV